MSGKHRTRYHLLKMYSLKQKLARDALIDQSQISTAVIHHTEQYSSQWLPVT